ncbi:MAG: cation transporter [Erysipelotrichaceae bacterium]
MKDIILLKDLECQNCVNKISNALEAANIDFEISLANKYVVINGNKDMLALAKRIIEETGFNIL